MSAVKGKWSDLGHKREHTKPTLVPRKTFVFQDLAEWMVYGT